MATMKSMISKCRMEKSAITRAYTFVQNPPEELFAEQIQSRLTRLECAWREFIGITGELYNFEGEEGYVDPERDMLEYEEKYMHSHAMLNRMLKSFSPHESTPEPHNEMFSRLAEQHSTLLQRLDSPNTSRHANEDLPKLRIEPFTGSYKDWPAFKDLFVSAIDSKANLSDIQKFHYLKSLLKDDAANLIKHMQISELAYSTAWDRLKERFDRPRHIVNSYIETFMGLSSMKEENAVNLRKISDISNEVVRGLDAVNYNERDHWLIYILQNKIDSESRRKWIENSRDDPKPTIAKFLKFLDQCCEELELGNNIATKSIGFKRSSSTALVSTGFQQNCADCGSDTHHTFKCPHFLSLAIDQRRTLVKEKSLCFNCLRRGHTAYNCKSQQKCRSCKRNHHTLLHFTQDTPIQQAHVVVSSEQSAHGNVLPEPEGSQPVSLNTVVSQSGTTLFLKRDLIHILPTALVDVRNHKGDFMICRILLDTASELSYISEDCMKRLGLPRNCSRIALSGISSVKAESTHGHSNLQMKSRNSQHSIDAQVHILGRITSSLPRSTITNYDRGRLEAVRLADPSFYRSNPIDILLGADYVWDVMTQEKLLDDKGRTIAVSTIFGLVVTSVNSSPQQQSTSSLLTLVDIDRSIQSFWEIEEAVSVGKRGDESAFVEQHFQETHGRHTDGRYIVELPFKEQNISFFDTYKGALMRFNATERRLSRDPQLYENYTKFMREYHSLGHMRELSPEEIDVEDGRLFYLPHHPIVGSKLRVVFDGSFQDANRESLNDKLHIGPSIQRNLFAVCFRFRLHKFVFSADIIKMFRQIWLAEKHRDYQRILWRENPNDQIKHFQLCTVTYGTASAPYLSVRVLEQLAKDYQESHPNASKVLLEDFYVDDVITGASTQEELMLKREELLDLLSQAGLELSKWVSNFGIIGPHGKDERNFLREDDSTKVLGIYWSSTEDTIRYRVNLEESQHATKRRVISDVARIFDPLGLVSPVVIKFKILFQELWLLNLDWDEPLPPNLAKLWIRYRNDLQNLTKLKLPRYVPNSNSSTQLHGFSDASIKAYAAVVYCRMEDEKGNIYVNIIASKTRVAPLKQISLPRLELCGALLLTRLMKLIISSLPHQQMEINAWCDSTVVLSWLSLQPTKLKTFVGNRTSEILETLPRNVWRHVNTKENPADCASRGLMVDQLLEHDLWWKGPSFLRNKERITSLEGLQPTFDNLEVLAEVKPTVEDVVANIATTTIHPLEIILQDVTHWYRLIRIAAYVKRFINLRIYKIKIPAEYLTYDEIKEGKIICLRMAQYSFSAERKSLQRERKIDNKSKLIQLSPFIDDDGLIRVGGRISNSELSSEIQHPIILPKEHKITKLILKEEHIRNLHPGISALFVIVRQHYWIFGARNLIRDLTHKCLKCFRQAQHVTQQRMADLPKVRVRQAFPFQNTGCDYAGPFTLKIHHGRNSKTSKGYICLFVCMVTSAIHLELATDLSTECFLAALRRFMARRGKCSTIYSDNGKNFVGAKRKLNEMYQQLMADNHNRIITEALAKDDIKWIFIPPYSPHWGGIWESGVRSVKLHLRRVIGSTILTFEQMNTLLAQVKPTTLVPEGNLTELKSNRLDYWQHVQCMYQGFWRRWSREYLTSLQQRPKWTNTQPNISMDDIVLIKEDNTPPSTWITGRVIETFPGSDGLTRAVRLKTSHGTMTRSIVKIVKLPIC
ncbi:uncharacterized protein LOC135955462 [Calliphora vicina]|uniref:uncharacterized protein LOC135955462 n=1 Tax=Calliphora vicina TaxID=7373 RepID=UPI00325A4CC0